MSEADRKAGVQAHMPSSSHEWNVYAAVRRRAAGLRRNSDANP
jgi:hypothetical protein